MVKNTIFGVVVLASVVALIATVGQAALVDGAQPNAINNESIVVDYDAITPVDEDGVDYDETVTIVHNGNELDAGTDYDWNAANGTVTWYNTAPTADGDNATITYTVHQIDETTRQYAQLTTIVLIGVALVVVWKVGTIAISGRF